MKRGYKTQYTHGIYTRGAMRQRDFIYEAIIAPRCQICDKTIERGNDSRGYPIGLSMWMKKKTCGYKWESGKLVFSDCAKAWRKVPQNNGMFKDIKNIPCKLCGKTGLSYRKKDKIGYGMCWDCWCTNRPEAYNKQDTKMIKCTRCDKEISNRWASGRLRPKITFCSKKCANTRHLTS